MNLVGIRNAVTSKVGRQILTIQKHSPAMLFGAGIVGVVATAVLASRATLKLENVLAEHEETMEKIEVAESIDRFTEKDAQKARALVYLRTFGKIGRLYLPALTIGIGSICALTGSHIILSRRNMALTAAYATLDKSFRQYRERVIAEYGDDADEKLRFGDFDSETLQTGNGPLELKKFKMSPDMSEYARFFDDTNPNWNPNAEYNRIFLSAQQSYFNNMLNARGHVFLNEVYDSLGMDRTGAGAVVGWLRGVGDSFVDFGLFTRTDSPQLRLFVNGGEPSVLLDFNVCGVIYDKI